MRLAVCVLCVGSASWLVDRSRVVRSNPRDLELFATRSDIWLLRRYFMDGLHYCGG